MFRNYIRFLFLWFLEVEEIPFLRFTDFIGDERYNHLVPSSTGNGSHRLLFWGLNWIKINICTHILNVLVLYNLKNINLISRARSLNYDIFKKNWHYRYCCLITGWKIFTIFLFINNNIFLYYVNYTIASITQFFNILGWNLHLFVNKIRSLKNWLNLQGFYTMNCHTFLVTIPNNDNNNNDNKHLTNCLKQIKQIILCEFQFSSIK